MSVLLAHFSDTHLVAPLSRRGWRMNRKQWLAFLNWWWRRRWLHRRWALHEALRQIITARADLAILTGDLTQLGRRVDYDFFYDTVKPLRAAGIPLLILDGNHDWYAGDYAVNDERDGRINAESERAEFARLRRELSLTLSWDGAPLRFGGIDILPIGGACVTPNLQAWGEITADNRAALFAAWQKHCAQNPQPLRLACGHFPLRGSSGKILPPALALRGGEEILTFLQQENFNAYLCGHLHKCFQLPLTTPPTATSLTQYCAGSLTIDGKLQFFSTANQQLQLLS